MTSWAFRGAVGFAACVMVLHADFGALKATTILDLQPYKATTSVSVHRWDNRSGTATLMNLNVHVGAWFLLTIDWGGEAAVEFYHLEQGRPGLLPVLGPAPHGLLHLEFSDGSAACELALGDPAASARPESLESARATQLPYAPLCDGRLYLRNPTVGRATSLERVTDFLRMHVWGGEKLISVIKKAVYADSFIERGEPNPMTETPPTNDSAPVSAMIDPAVGSLALVPPHLGLDPVSSDSRLLLGRWYAVRDLSDVYLSVSLPGVVPRRILLGAEPGVNPLDEIESKALVYLVAFDLAKFDLHFVMGTEHPGMGWSPRPPAASQDASMPGPDGIGGPAPLVPTGMIPPAAQRATVATFAGGFKREHGAFRFGPLALRNHGSHYGFVEQGVVFSVLQPGLATVTMSNDGAVEMLTWSEDHSRRMAGVRDARQNGLPLVEFDAGKGSSVPGDHVNSWGEGNWSGSANEDLRTLRAGLCLQESGSRRFLIYAYFSAATPSAMARVFQAYRCRYAMHLDMNALEHTYMAAYSSTHGQRGISHLIQGMEVLDRQVHGQIVPRFLGFPDDRDFFYVTRK